MWIDNRISQIAIVCNLLLGCVVLITNGRRASSRTFFFLTILIAGWVYSIDKAVMSPDTARAAFWIRVCSFFGPLVIAEFALLRITIIHFQENWDAHVWRARIWIGLSAVAAAICCTHFFLRGAEMRLPVQGIAMAPKALYGPGQMIYLLFFLVGGLTVSAQLIRDQFDRNLHGIRRVELQFVALALLCLVLSVAVTTAYISITGNAGIVRFTSLRIIAFDAIITYGIASRGILHVGAAFRLLLSYLLLALYAGAIFLIGWVLFRSVFTRAFSVLENDSNFTTSFCAAVLTALLFNMTGTPVRNFTRKILPPEIDLERIITEVSHIVQSMTTLENLLGRFSNYLSRMVGSPKITVLVREDGGLNLWRIYPAEPDRVFMHMPEMTLGPLLKGEADLALEDLQRKAPSPERDMVLDEMGELETDLVLAVRYQGNLAGLLLFAPRTSGQIYGGTGRTALRLIAEQLGVALTNSRLYTEARKSEAYNQFLVEHLSCGVIATDPQGMLTVVNPEARRLLHLDEAAPPREIELMPEIADLIMPTLQGDMVAHDEELILRPGARDQAHLRVSCLPFASENESLLGAVLVINDFTAVERLQRQVRQADRLASIGTLASGMAHEIKNPLTALKTFTQLLPKRYNDAEFRQDFSGLAGSEIARIERIVNQLLAFARPTPLMVEQVSLHEIVDAAMRLIAPQASRLNVELRKAFHATDDHIAADRDRLQQVLLNLLLNALQATPPGGVVELTTALEPGDADHDAFMRLDVRDTGSGIPPEMLARVFDPFFTTKSEGTGLGLSVSYNLVAEHKGRLEVSSEVGQGTCFSVYLPVA